MKKRFTIGGSVGILLAGLLVFASVTSTLTVKAAEDTNVQKLQDGSFAYFEDNGVTDALDALNNSTYAALTVRGDELDATSFQNMLDSFQWIKECNRLRELNGLEPLLVNDTLMAMAQADANYSDTVVGHAKQFNVGENCAWNYGSNPFTQWYDKEKAIYDAMETPAWTNETGHYLNIITAEYKTTGFAITTRGTMNGWNTYTQVFSYSDDGIPVEEYEQRVIDYYNSLTSNETPDSGDIGGGDNGSSDSTDNSNSDNSDNSNSGNSDNSNSGNSDNSNSGNSDNSNSGNSDNSNSGNIASSDSEDSTSTVSEISTQIANAESGATIKITGVTTLSNGNMKELLKKGDVTLVLEYTYKDVDYVVTIPAGAAMDNDIPWYGPLYLAGHYGNGTSANGAAGSVYTVKAKDTLSRIARANGMTLSQLVAKNPQIKDLNRIYIGQQINLQ